MVLKNVLLTALAGLFLTVIALVSNTAMVSTNAQEKEGESRIQSASPEATFTNATPITIPAGPANGAPYPSAITVAGITGTIPTTAGSVKVTINQFSHTFPDDVGIVLVGPNGDALLLQNGAGDDPNMNSVTYTLSDTGATILPDDDAWGPGTYKPTTYYTGDSFPAPGPGTTYASPGPTGGGTATFTSVFGGDNPNGTWNLFVRDLVAGDAGTIAGGWTLEIVTGPTAPTQNILDFNGDGRTDYSLTRVTNTPGQGQLRWFNFHSGGAAGSGNNEADWGLDGDRVVPLDYDGDNKTDIAVWRAGPPFGSYFYILRSMTNTVQQVEFGQTGDDPSVTDDYTGDGLADPAVYRAGLTVGAKSRWFFRASSGPLANQTVGTEWGQNGDTPMPGDQSGDGRADFCVRRVDGGSPSQARFFTRNGTGGGDPGGNGTSIQFGIPTDLLVPGDWDGDGRVDIAVARGIAGQWNLFVVPSSTGTISGAPFAVFGNSATDIIAHGDYDGDGTTDMAVWRSNPDPTQNFFFVRGSTSGPFQFEYGRAGDRPTANYNTH